MTRLRMTKELPMAHGELIDGVWHTRFHNTKATGGRFQRGQPKFRNWVTANGSAIPTGDGGFPAARGRYHLYVSLAWRPPSRVPVGTSHHRVSQVERARGRHLDGRGRTGDGR